MVIIPALLLCSSEKRTPKPEYKRYMVFEFFPYEAGGGLEECEESFNNKEDAIKYCRIMDKDYYCEILDRVAGIEIEWKIPDPPKPERSFLKEQREKRLNLWSKENEKPQ